MPNTACSATAPRAIENVTGKRSVISSVTDWCSWKEYPRQGAAHWTATSAEPKVRPVKIAARKVPSCTNHGWSKPMKPRAASRSSGEQGLPHICRAGSMGAR